MVVLRYSSLILLIGSFVTSCTYVPYSVGMEMADRDMMNNKFFIKYYHHSGVYGGGNLSLPSVYRSLLLLKYNTHIQDITEYKVTKDFAEKVDAYNNRVWKAVNKKFGYDVADSCLRESETIQQELMEQYGSIDSLWTRDLPYYMRIASPVSNLQKTLSAFAISEVNVTTAGSEPTTCQMSFGLTEPLVEPCKFQQDWGRAIDPEPWNIEQLKDFLRKEESH